VDHKLKRENRKLNTDPGNKFEAGKSLFWIFLNISAKTMCQQKRFCQASYFSFSNFSNNFTVTTCC